MTPAERGAKLEQVNKEIQDFKAQVDPINQTIENLRLWKRKNFWRCTNDK